MIIDFIIEDLMLNSYLQKNFHTLENAGLMGVPLPAVITKAIDILQKKAEKDGE